MAMVISTNTASINAQRHLNSSARELNVAMERLSSGQRINSAADDAAGLAIRDKMTSQVEGLNQAVRNANDAISFMQSAEGALEETTNILQRMRTLAVQAVNDTNSSSDRLNLNAEIGKLQEEITRIAQTSTFNNKNLIDGSMTSSVFQVGHNSGQTIEVGLNNMSSEALGSTSPSTGATFEAKTLTVAGTVATGDTVVLNLGTGASADSIGTLTYTAATGDTTTTAIAALQVLATASHSDKFTFTAEGNVLTMTSKTTGVSGRFNASESGTIVFANDTSATTQVLETVDGVEAVSVAQTSKVGITGKLNAGKMATLTITNTADSSTQVLTHTAGAADLKGNDLVKSFGEQANDKYSFKVEGNSLIVTSKAGGSVAAFTVAITENDTISSTTASQLNADSLVTTAAVDGAKASSSTTISQISVTDRTKAAAAILVIDEALGTVGQERSKLGAFQNRLTHAVNNMTNMSANTAAAKSVVADADYAAESSSLAKNQILQQAGTAMLAQANAQAQSVLSLLK